MNYVSHSPRGRASVVHRSPWPFILLFLTIAGLSLVVAPGETWARFGTTPPPPAAPLTVLVGPVADVAPDESTLTVANVPITTNDETRVDKRVGPLEEGAWARVEGLGDGNGGIVAARIKVLPPAPLVKLIGPLDNLSDTALQIDVIPLNRTVTTLIIGDLTPGEDRVAARAAVESNGDLLAIQVVKANPIRDEDDDDDDDNVPPGQTKLTGVVIALPDGGGLAGTWNVSGIPVSVPSEDVINAHMGPVTEGSWVKITGHVEGDSLVAERIQTTHSRHFHKLSGVLTELTESDVSVDGIQVALGGGATIRGNPQVGDRVFVKGNLDSSNNFEAVLVQGRGHNGNPPPTQPGLVIRFTGEVQQLPPDGLYGTWRIAERDVNVPAGAFIDEHKGSVTEGAFVEVTALLGDDNSITAVVIVVTRSSEGGDNGGNDDHEGDWTEFSGVIRELPSERHDNNPLVGDWDVDGTTVHVSRRTDISRHDQNIEVGVEVRVAGWLQSDDSVRAARIEVVQDHRRPIRFVGAITDLPDDLHDGSWMVDQREVVVGAATELDDEHGDFVIGQRVKVSGYERDDGAVDARAIEALRTPEVDYVGRIAIMPPDLVGEWTVGEKTVLTNNDTDFRQDNGAFAEGLLVKVKGRLQADGSIQASRLETLPMPKIEHIGEIVTLPNSEDLTGIWQIGLLNYLVTPDTVLDAGDGEFSEGMVVRAKGRMRADGVVIADKIEALYD